MEGNWGLLAMVLAAMGVGIYLGAEFIKREDGRSVAARLMTRLFGRRHPLPPPLEPEITPPPPPPPPPEPTLDPVPANFGNIKPKLGEETDPDTFGPEVHDFPEVEVPATPFEDFNRRLFIYGPPGRNGSFTWGDTLADDFATRIAVADDDRLLKEIHRRLRPRYPVILDTYGFWARASRNLEQFPGYMDDFVQAYLAIPEQQRPVVVSRAAFSEEGQFIFLRYGFDDFEVPRYRFSIFFQECLQLIMAALTGPREGWLWFSVARLRQAASAIAQANQERLKESQAAAYLEEETRKAKAEAEHRNRFVALFENRIPPTVVQPAVTTAGGSAKP